MKKVIALTMMTMLVFCTCAQARTQYDRGNKIIHSNTIRGEQRAKQEKILNENKMEAAAAAKLNYEEAVKMLYPERPKSNFIQSKIKEENMQKYGK